MRKPFYLLLVAISLILTACPYESDVKLNEHEEALKINKKLTGEWIAYHDNGAREELLLTKIERSTLEITHKQYESNKKLFSNKKYVAQSTNIGGYELFNIKTPKGKYFFAKYGWIGKNKIYIQAVNDNFMEINFKTDSVTSKTLSTFLTKYVNFEKLYGGRLEFYRKNSPEHQKVKGFMRKSGF